MVVCQVCGRKLRSERGLSIHLARVHDVRGPRGRLSLKILHQFFPLLQKKKWTCAERALKRVAENDLEDDWRKGYSQALRGMITALRMDHSSPQPYILKLAKCDRRRIQEVKREFIKQSKKPLNTEFDKGYFQAWTDYTHYLLNKSKESPKRKGAR